MADDLEIAAVLHFLVDAELAANRQERRQNDAQNPFDLSDQAFVRLFRLNKQLAENLINSLEEHLIPQQRRSALSIQTKVLCTLRFLACGGYQVGVGNDINLAISQPSVSRSVEEVCSAINTHLFNNWVRFPRDLNELNETRTAFYRKYGFPGIIGAIDCTHVAIFPPNADDPVHPEHIYVNRKGYHSINVQLVCDSNLKITNINARYPRSTNDAFIWRNCNLKTAIEALNNNHNTMWLIGDSGYPLQPYPLTPIQDAQPNAPEDRYNIAHRVARNVIERCNGVLKSRFRCLLKHRVLHYKPDKASLIINACSVLHNMCISENIAEPELEEGDHFIDFGIEDVNVGIQANNLNPVLHDGRRIRQHVVNTYYR